MRVGVSSRGNAWVSMGCLGWLLFGPFILAWYVLCALGVLVAAAYSAITGTVREVRPEPTAAKLERQASRHRIAGIVILSVCGVIAVAMVVAAL